MLRETPFLLLFKKRSASMHIEHNIPLNVRHIL